ncbi:MAG TPA: CocE/NonD family hydrolase, partial [Solirubrobacteraceae bacterium]
MLPRRRILPAVVALCAAVLPAAPAAAADFSKQALTFDVKVGPNGDTPCTVTADLYTPSGATPANPAPAILATNGFGGSKADFGDLAAAYARRGYVFLAYSGLGFGGSGCKITLDDREHDGSAGSQLVSFLGGSKAANDGTKVDYVIHDATDHAGKARADDPRIGMIGGSYGGQIQFAVAGIDARMDALVPQITWNDLSYSLTPNNTDFASGVTYKTPGVSKIDWPVLFTGLGVGQGIQHAFSDQDPSHLGACPNFDDRVCTALVQSGSTGYPDPTTLELLRHASVATYVDRIRIPTFLSQGLSDTLFDTQEAVATYRALRAQGTPVKMLWRSAGHSGGDLGTAENDETNLERAYESRLELEWFDYYLRGIGDPPALDFSFVRDWAVPKSGDAAPAVGETPNYPAARDAALYLSGADALVDGAGAVKAGSASMAAVPAAPTN